MGSGREVRLRGTNQRGSDRSRNDGQKDPASRRLMWLDKRSGRCGEFVPIGWHRLRGAYIREWPFRRTIPRDFGLHGKGKRQCAQQKRDRSPLVSN
jgi:hypothetical protein